jgi:hydroxymethylbilane synthase
MGKQTYIIGSRGSKLALWQAEHVKQALEHSAPSLKFQIELIKTAGDANTRAPLSVIGGLGVFTKEIEDALLSGRIDIAVHSLKDLPTGQPEGLTIAAVSEREETRDALVLPDEGMAGGALSIKEIPHGARVGTSSRRRSAQLKHLREDLEILDIRGNVDTRLRKLDSGEYDVIVLAAAGLIRLSLAERISGLIPLDLMVPAVGQGALAIETRREDETEAMVRVLDHPPTRAAVEAERSFLRTLGGGCTLPIGGHAVSDGESMKLLGLVASESGEEVLRESIEGPTNRAAELGEKLGRRMIENGALGLLG